MKKNSGNSLWQENQFLSFNRNFSPATVHLQPQGLLVSFKILWFSHNHSFHLNIQRHRHGKRATQNPIVLVFLLILIFFCFAKVIFLSEFASKFNFLFCFVFSECPASGSCGPVKISPDHLIYWCMYFCPLTSGLILYFECYFLVLIFLFFLLRKTFKTMFSINIFLF